MLVPYQHRVLRNKAGMDKRCLWRQAYWQSLIATEGCLVQDKPQVHKHATAIPVAAAGQESPPRLVNQATIAPLDVASPYLLIEAGPPGYEIAPVQLVAR